MKYRNIPVRDARDHLSELLGLGRTYPLRDVPVGADGLTVPTGQTARIPIGLSQKSVEYELHDDDDRPVARNGGGASRRIRKRGTGQTIHIETPAITDDTTFKILAKKPHAISAYLHKTATIKVGLDVTLRARIRSHPPLDPTNDTPVHTDPRLADFGDRVNVEIERSQEGVDYRLVHLVDDGGGGQEEVSISDAGVLGTGENIVVSSAAVTEDTVIRIRASKDFDVSARRPAVSKLLDVELPLKIRANPTLTVGVAPRQVVATGEAAGIRIEASQASVRYRLHLHAIEDPEVVHDPATDAQVLRVREAGEPEVQIRRPVITDPWGEMEGYKQEGDHVVGTGGALTIPLGEQAADCIVIVEALKAHDTGGGRTISSACWLAHPAVVLRRPDPAPEIALRVTMDGAQSDGLMQVSGGQPGVFYYFRTAEDGADMQWPAYFHKRDAHDPHQNQGLGQLEVGIDFSVAADPEAGASGSPMSRPPPSPVLKTGPLAVGTRLHVRAARAQTRIAVPLDKTAVLFPLPDIAPAESAVASGDTVDVTVSSSNPAERYQLALAGQTVGAAKTGTGGDLTLQTRPVRSDSIYEVWVTRPDDPGLAVVQVVPVTITVRT